MVKLTDLTGQKFGRLAVIKKIPNKNRHIYWLVKCDCGTILEVQATHLKSGHTKSCGCIRQDKPNAIKHGLRYHPRYKVWISIKHRTTNPKYVDYKYYGARGIKVYKGWLDDPADFIKYCETLPGWDNPSLTFDRINNDGDYEPGNLRFVTRSIQNANKRTTSSTGEKYIYFDKRKQQYQILKKINGRSKHFGLFTTLKEAIDYRDKYLL